MLADARSVADLLIDMHGHFNAATIQDMLQIFTQEYSQIALGVDELVL